MSLSKIEQWSVAEINNRIFEAASQLDPNGSLPQKVSHALIEKHEYDLSEFLAYYDEAFIINSFRCILGRPPDTGTIEVLNSLRSGHISREEVLCNIKYSKEGLRRGVIIHGLMPRLGYHFFKFKYLPLFGFLFKIIHMVIRLPKLQRDIRALETKIMVQEEHTEQKRNKNM
jgi:hypothetical protein